MARRKRRKLHAPAGEEPIGGNEEGVGWHRKHILPTVRPGDTGRQRFRRRITWTKPSIMGYSFVLLMWSNREGIG